MAAPTTTTQLPGFTHPVHDAQKTFRALLDALARPGIEQSTATVTPPDGLTVGCGAACLTLLDLETTLWLQPGIPDVARTWLLFHTGCRFTDDPQAADFALIADLASAPDLSAFNWGTPEYPEASTTLLIQLSALAGNESTLLQGPGILHQITVTAPLDHHFWMQWHGMTASYPLGLDAWCFTDNQVIGLPRTAQLAGTQSDFQR